MPRLMGFARQFCECNMSALCGEQGLLPPKTYQKAKTLVLTAGVAVLGVLTTVVIGYVMASPTFGWTGMRHHHTTSLRVHSPAIVAFPDRFRAGQTQGRLLWDVLLCVCVTVWQHSTRSAFSVSTMA